MASVSEGTRSTVVAAVPSSMPVSGAVRLLNSTVAEREADQDAFGTAAASADVGMQEA
jgi:hypothetical protein